MSKIVSPYPPLKPDENYNPPAGAKWWRLGLRTNDDGYNLIMETDSRPDDSEQGFTTPTWVSWEFFDDADTVIDTGLDRLFPVRLVNFGVGGYIDVLHVGPPTPSPYWQQLPIPGHWPHPDAATSRYERSVDTRVTTLLVGRR